MPKRVFKRHLDISSALLKATQVPLLTTFGPLGLLWRIFTLFVTGGTRATLPQTCSSMLSEVSNAPEEVMVTELHISSCNFAHQGNSNHIIHHSKSLKTHPRLELSFWKTEKLSWPITYILYQKTTNYLLNSKPLSLGWCSSTWQPHQCNTSTLSAAANRTISLCCCTVLWAAAQYSICCCTCQHKKHLPLQAHITTDCVPYLMSCSGFPSKLWF